MTKRTPSKGAKASEKSENSSVRKRLGLLKGILFIVVAGLALAAGIYNGGEGIFFGAVFAMGFGLLGALCFIRNDKTTKSRGR